MSSLPTITVEFFGMARRRAGRPSLQLCAATVADALAAATLACPSIGTLVNGRDLSPHFLASVNAGPFIADLSWALAPGDRVLVLSADSGG